MIINKLCKSLSDSLLNMQEYMNMNVKMYAIYNICMFYYSI